MSSAWRPARQMATEAKRTACWKDQLNFHARLGVGRASGLAPSCYSSPNLGQAGGPEWCLLTHFNRQHIKDYIKNKQFNTTKKREKSRVSLTQAAQLFDDGCQGAVGDTLQFTGHSIRQSSSTQVLGLDTPLHQRHDWLLLRERNREAH